MTLLEFTFEGGEKQDETAGGKHKQLPIQCFDNTRQSQHQQQHKH